MSFHSYGDLWIMPFSYVKDPDNRELARKEHILYEAYQEFNAHSYKPDGAKFGNAMKTIHYQANGEATDWMLAARNVFAFSPELGIKDKASHSFYPRRFIHKETIATDYKVVRGFIKMHLPFFSLQSESSNLGGQYITDESNFSMSTAKKWASSEAELTLFNHGVSHLKNIRIFFRYQIDISSPEVEFSYEATQTAKVAEKKSAVKLNPLKVKKVGQQGYLSEPVIILRRSYLHLKFSRTLGDQNNFVLLFERNGEYIGRFIHVRSKQDLENLFKLI